MNALTRDLEKLVREKEKETGLGRFRQKLHLMPPTGWLNDPNGLCQFDNVYHAFFQYSPFDVNGGVKMWGHYISHDLTEWEYRGTALYPDQPFDCHGVYSGCAYVEHGTMYLYYTGNVKHEDGDYDYTLTGREGNTVLVTSTDGHTFSGKKLLMRNEDYPSDLSCHVRDPKVWKQDGRYYMIQGVRTKEDVGEAQIFVSEDKWNWKPGKRIRTKQPFGYMWECPDYMKIGNRKIFSASVQGLTGEEWKERNVYQSGYFFVEGDLLSDYGLSEYHLWDYGFDYYAPQSFQDKNGRTILIGWMGMPDCEEYGNTPATAEGWQHCFTFPREVFEKDGKVYQRPVRELDARKQLWKAKADALKEEDLSVFEVNVTEILNNDFHVVLAEKLVLEYKDREFRMYFTEQDKDGVSGGRSTRRKTVEKLEDVKVLGDVSSVEVFLNGGEVVFSTRYYPEKYSVEINAKGAKIEIFTIREI